MECTCTKKHQRAQEHAHIHTEALKCKTLGFVTKYMYLSRLMMLCITFMNLIHWSILLRTCTAYLASHLWKRRPSQCRKQATYKKAALHACHKRIMRKAKFNHEPCDWTLPFCIMCVTHIHPLMQSWSIVHEHAKMHFAVFNVMTDSCMSSSS